MRWVRALLIASLCIVPLSAKAWWQSIQQVGVSGGGGGYVGPVDVIASPFLIASVRCASTSYTGNVMDVWDTATGSTTETLVTCSSGGVLNQTINPLSTTCAVSCSVKTFYDQSGANNCSGPCNFAQTGAVGTWPTLLNYATAASWRLNFIAASSQILASATTSGITAPFPIASVLARSANFTSFGYFISAQFGSFKFQGGGSPNAQIIYAGNFGSLAASDGINHSFQFNMANGTLSVNVVDGAATTFDTGSGDLSGSQLYLGADGNGGFGDVNISEVAFYPTGTWSSGQYTSMHLNQKAYFGTP